MRYPPLHLDQSVAVKFRGNLPPSDVGSSFWTKGKSLCKGSPTAVERAESKARRMYLTPVLGRMNEDDHAASTTGEMVVPVCELPTLLKGNGVRC